MWAKYVFKWAQPNAKAILPRLTRQDVNRILHAQASLPSPLAL